MEINVKDKYHDEIVDVWKEIKRLKDQEPILKEVHKKVDDLYKGDIVKAWEQIKNVKNKEERPLFEIAYNFETIYRRGAFVQDTLYKDGILFLGIGASYDEKKIETVEIKEDIQYETEQGRKYPYYSKMSALVEAAGLEHWSNIDITLLRETKQNKVEPFFKNLPDIMNKQLNLAVQMMKDITPQVIMVNNAFVRKVMKDNFIEERDKKGNPKEKKFPDIKQFFKFDESEPTIEKYGTPVITEPAELKGTPIFFTCMLSSSPHTLDIGSYERLKWHIKWLNKNGLLRKK